MKEMMNSVMKRLDALEKKSSDGKKDHAYLNEGPTTDPKIMNPDNESTGKESKKSVGLMIAMLKARKTK